MIYVKPRAYCLSTHCCPCLHHARVMGKGCRDSLTHSRLVTDGTHRPRAPASTSELLKFCLLVSPAVWLWDPELWGLRGSLGCGTFSAKTRSLWQTRMVGPSW